MAGNYYDKASRFAAKLDSAGFVGWLLDLPAERFTFRRWLETRGVPFPGNPDRVGDTVAHLDNAAEHGVPWALAVEFQSQPDPEMFGRLLGYLSGLWLNVRPDSERGSRFHVGAAVVNLAGSGSAAREMRWGAAGLATHLAVVERNLERESAEELLAGIEAGRLSRCLLPWVPLMSGGERAETVDRWKVAASGDPSSRRRAEFAVLAILFANKAGRKVLWQEKLEGWNVEESEYVNEWIAVGEARGEARGVALGEARGEARGQLREACGLILRLGARRFGPAPAAAEAAIRAIGDRDRLERIAERTLDATGWDDLLATP